MSSTPHNPAILPLSPANGRPWLRSTAAGLSPSVGQEATLHQWISNRSDAFWKLAPHTASFLPWLKRRKLWTPAAWRALPLNLDTNAVLFSGGAASPQPSPVPPCPHTQEDVSPPWSGPLPLPPLFPLLVLGTASSSSTGLPPQPLALSYVFTSSIGAVTQGNLGPSFPRTLVSGLHAPL